MWRLLDEWLGIAILVVLAVLVTLLILSRIELARCRARLNTCAALEIR